MNRGALVEKDSSRIECSSLVVLDEQWSQLRLIKLHSRPGERTFKTASPSRHSLKIIVGVAPAPGSFRPGPGSCSGRQNGLQEARPGLRSFAMSPRPISGRHVNTWSKLIENYASRRKRFRYCNEHLNLEKA